MSGRILRVFFISLFFYSIVLSQNDSIELKNEIATFVNAKLFTIDPLNNIIVYDAGSHSFIGLKSNGDTIGTFGGYGWNETTFDNPRDIISKNGLDYFMVDYGNNRILHLDRNLNFLSAFPSKDNIDISAPVFRYPLGVDIDRFGKLYVINGEDNTIWKINKDDIVERKFGGLDAGKGSLSKPQRIRISNDDKLYVQDNNKIIVYDLLGNYIRTIGESILKSLKTFCVDRNYVYILDSCSVIRVDTQGRIESVTLLSKIIQKINCKEVIDFSVKDERVYFLSPHYVTVATVDLTADSEKN